MLEQPTSPEDASGRVVVQGCIRAKGTLHPRLPRLRFSPEAYSALTAAPAGPDGDTAYSLQLGPDVVIRIQPDMTLTPTLKQHSTMHAGAEAAPVQLHGAGQSVSLLMGSEAQHKQWYRALREALSESIFISAFAQRTAAGGLCASAIEAAVDRSLCLVPAAHCHVLRARRVLDMLRQVHTFAKRVRIKPHCVPREQAEAFLQLAAESDPLLCQDGDVAFIRHLLPRLLRRDEIDSHKALDSHAILEESHRILGGRIGEVPPSLLQRTDCQEMDSCQLSSAIHSPAVKAVSEVSVSVVSGADKENLSHANRDPPAESRQVLSCVAATPPRPRRSAGPDRSAHRTHPTVCKSASPLPHVGSDCVVVIDRSKKGRELSLLRKVKRRDSSDSEVGAVIATCPGSTASPSEECVRSGVEVIEERDIREGSLGRSMRLFYVLLLLPLMIGVLIRAESSLLVRPGVAETRSAGSHNIYAALPQYSSRSVSNTHSAPVVPYTAMARPALLGKEERLTGQPRMAELSGPGCTAAAPHQFPAAVVGSISVVRVAQSGGTEDAEVYLERARRREAFLDAVLYSAVD